MLTASARPTRRRRWVFRYCFGSQAQARGAELRFYQIRNILRNPTTARSGCWLGREWGILDSLQDVFEKENDGLYGGCDHLYFRAVSGFDARARAAQALVDRRAAAAKS